MTWIILHACVHFKGVDGVTVIIFLGLPGAPPAPLLEVVNVTMVMVQLQSPDDTGRLTISQYHVSMSICLYVM